MGDLTSKKCVPCEGGTLPLPAVAIDEYQNKLKEPWDVGALPAIAKATGGQGKISKKFKFKDFEQAIDFVNQVASIAQDEGHHPNIHVVEYNKVVIELWTHAIGGLSVNDFIVAAKIDEL